MGEISPEPLEQHTCSVRDGKFVDPCSTLLSVVDNIAPGFSNVRGVARWEYFNQEWRVRSRTFFGVKSKEHPKGMLFNFCPFCGVKIDAPFNSDDDAADPVADQVPA